MDWNYYLGVIGTEIYYEGYIKQKWKYSGSYWKGGERSELNRKRAIVEMDPQENGKNFPIGHFIGDVFEPYRYFL